MKYMILTYASQQDYDAMAGKATGRPALAPEDFAPMRAAGRSVRNCGFPWGRCAAISRLPAAHF